MSNPDLLLNATYEAMLERYKTDSSQLEPTVFAYKDDELIGEVTLDFENDFMKDISAMATKAWLKAIQADASVFVSESWVVSYKKTDPDDKPDLKNEPPPSQHPDRIEVLTVFLDTKEFSIVIASKMLRDEEGNVTGFEEFQKLDSRDQKAGVGGRMCFMREKCDETI